MATDVLVVAEELVKELEGTSMDKVAIELACRNLELGRTFGEEGANKLGETWVETEETKEPRSLVGKQGRRSQQRIQNNICFAWSLGYQNSG